MEREQESLPKVWESLQEIIIRFSHHDITKQRLVYIFYGGVSSHNRRSLDATCGGNLMLKTPVDAIKITKDMCSKPCNNSGDMRIMKRGINLVDTAESQTKLEK